MTKGTTAPLETVLVAKCPACGKIVRRIDRLQRIEHEAPECAYFAELMASAPGHQRDVVVVTDLHEPGVPAAIDVPAVDELADHYARACKGDKRRALLMALDAGFGFKEVVGAMGMDGVRLAFDCITRGWIDRGQITDAGRAELERGAES
jgi:hypothetical protein